jgi:hypothetical protein
MTEDQWIEQRKDLIDRRENQRQSNKRPISAQIPKEKSHVGISASGKGVRERALQVVLACRFEKQRKKIDWIER